MKERNLARKLPAGITYIKHSPGSLSAILMLCFCLSNCSSLIDEGVAPIQHASTEAVFQRYELVTGQAKHQVVLTGFLFGRPVAEIVVISVDDSDNRYMHIYGFSGGIWGLIRETKLRPGVLFVDLAEIGGRDRLITYEMGRLNWFDPATGVVHPLVEITTTYKSPADGGILHVDITRDLNGDGLSDLIVPDLSGFWIATQLSDGAFSDPIKLGPPDPFLDAIALDDTRLYCEVGITDLTALWYMSRVHQIDYDQDGQLDLVFWNTDHFEVYRQEARGTFSEVAEAISVDIPFDTDGAYSLAFGFSDVDMFSLIFGFRENMKRTVLHTFQDMNGDGVADMILHSLEGRSLGSQRSHYAVHFGTSTSEGIRFAREAGMTIRPRGAAGGLQPWGYSSLWLEDIDGDGEIDVLFRDVQTGLMGMSRAMLGNSISIDLEFYRMRDGTYPDQPTAFRSIRPDFSPFDAHGVFFPAVLLGDMNGDGRSDLLIGENWNELHILFGVSGPERFARVPQKIEITMPNDERNIRLVDINNDKKQDILIYYPSTTGSHQVTLLVTR